MVRSTTPFSIFRWQLGEFRAALPQLLEGNPVGIHDARVATRRIREVLPLTHEWDRFKIVDDLQSAFKRVGRSLGRVRDVDVRVDLLKYLEPRIGDAAPAVHLLRRHQERRRLELMRKLIKRLERLAVDREVGRLENHPARPEPWRPRLRPSRWRRELRHLVDERSGATCDAMAHATGVYFPNRTHRVRIAIKKFRYASEIASATGLLHDDAVIRHLRKAQDLLGELHDRETLIGELDRMVSDNGGAEPRQIHLIQQLAEAEIGELHARFLARREQVVDCCRLVHHAVAPSDPRVGVAVTSAIAVAGLVALQAVTNPR